MLQVGCLMTEKDWVNSEARNLHQNWHTIAIKSIMIDTRRNCNWIRTELLTSNSIISPYFVNHRGRWATSNVRDCNPDSVQRASGEFSRPKFTIAGHGHGPPDWWIQVTASSLGGLPGPDSKCDRTLRIVHGENALSISRLGLSDGQSKRHVTRILTNHSSCRYLNADFAGRTPNSLPSESY